MIDGIYRFDAHFSNDPFDSGIETTKEEMSEGLKVLDEIIGRDDHNNNVTVSRMRIGLNKDRTRLAVAIDPKTYSTGTFFIENQPLYPVVDKSDLQKVRETAARMLKNYRKEMKGQMESMKTEIKQHMNNENTADLAKQKELEDNPLIKDMKRLSNGHYVLAEAGDMELCIYGTSGSGDFTKSANVYAKKGGELGNPISVTLRNIQDGGSAIGAYMQNLGVFDRAAIALAQQRAWLLERQSKIEFTEEPRLKTSEIYEIYMNRIKNGADDDAVFVEEVADRIDIGIWDDDFARMWDLEIKDNCDISRVQWGKQAHAQGWLVPDEGRGSGQHNPSEALCRKYGKSPSARIQRFVIDEELAKRLLKARREMDEKQERKA